MGRADPHSPDGARRREHRAHGPALLRRAINDAVYARAPYNGHTGQRTLNDQDGIFANGGAASTVALTRDGDGYTGEITLGVRS